MLVIWLVMKKQHRLAQVQKKGQCNCQQVISSFKLSIEILQTFLWIESKAQRDETGGLFKNKQVMSIRWINALQTKDNHCYSDSIEFTVDKVLVLHNCVIINILWTRRYLLSALFFARLLSITHKTWSGKFPLNLSG